MIDKEEVLEIAKKYLKDRKRDYIFLEENIEKIFLEENMEITNNKYDEELKNVYIIFYDTEGYQQPESNSIYIDADTGEVYYTLFRQGRVEDWE